MGRARITPVKKSVLVPRDECSHLVKNHRPLAYSSKKKVMLCESCGAHFIVTEEGKATRKVTFGES